MAGFLPHTIKESIMITQPATPRPTRLTDQSTTWPLFFILPQTHYVQRQRAANSPEYRPKPQPDIAHHRTARTTYPHENWLQAILRREVEILQEAIADIWIVVQEAGRAMVKWLAWKVVFPLSVACAIWVPIGNPMDLPL
jgi:hypothetical protein